MRIYYVYGPLVHIFMYKEYILAHNFRKYYESDKTMKLLKPILATAFTVALGTGVAQAGCGLSGEVGVISGQFPILDSLKKELESCNGDGFNVTWKNIKQPRQEAEVTFGSDNNPYNGGLLSNGDIANLQGKGLLMPLDDLVAKYKDKYNIEANMPVKINGVTYAVAFMGNAQHFMYRKDLFDKYGLSAPETYDDVIKAAEVLKQESSIEYQFGAAYKSGWNLAQEFNNIYMGFGGEYFKPGTLEPAFNNQAGVKALNLMKKMMSYMSPNALVLDSGAVQNQLRQGKIPMAFLWASRAAGVDDPKESKVVGKIAFSKAPAVMAGGNSATTTWWNGLALARTNTPKSADAVFQALASVISDANAVKYQDTAIWLRSAYTPTKYAKGVIESFEAGAPSYPMSSAYGLIHGAMGKVAGEVMSGQLTPEQALAKAEEEYLKTAKEKGHLN